MIRLDPKFVYAYINRGNVYALKSDVDRAIADFNEAIKLEPTYAIAYNNRGNVYRAKGDLDRAIADFNEAIRLDPKYSEAFTNRATTYKDKGDLDRAIADHTQAIALHPKSADAYFFRGITYLYGDVPEKALADLHQASELGPKSAYRALWLDIANKRNGQPSRLAEAMARIDMTIWPAPVIRLYLGQMTVEAVLAAADNPDAQTKERQICQANFYTAELKLQRGEKDEATHLFRLAAGSVQRGS